ALGFTRHTVDRRRATVPGVAVFTFRPHGRGEGPAMKNLCVYCGSNTGSKPIYQEQAIALGTRLAKDGIGLVYGGGNIGLMGAVADAVMQAGGQVTGVTPEPLVQLEVAHIGVIRRACLHSMHTTN